ncbi:MAG: sigma-54-dependent Fis family transcriptional regulator [Phycisphaerae bacterium]|nr:sigma-54-dependent Fis family transcriptional regulator [Phycisphaerae bacterium]
MITKTILLTSHYPSRVVEMVRRQWKVIDIPDQREALAFLRACTTMPWAISIGIVDNTDPKAFDGKSMLREIHKLDANIPVIVSTHQRSPAVIVDFVKHGAFDYVVEPQDDNDVEQWTSYTQDFIFALTRAMAWREIMLENQRLKDDLICRDKPDFIKGRSSAVLNVVNLIRKVAPTPATVLITGESGTGKELVARAIHSQSTNREHPFTPINCGSISESLLASELFGHVKGAFTGADAHRQGLLRETGSGTLLLDEIATIPPSFQVMLLRVLEQRTARPVGGTGDYNVTCRFLAAANCNLEDLVREDKFREDLFYRLNVFHIHIPPLRQRREDIPILADFFLKQTASQYGKDIKGISPGAMEILEEYAWPGNVRQLRHAIERATILCESDALGIGDFDPRIRSSTIVTDGFNSLRYDQAMMHFERNLIQSALAQCQGNRSQAANLLHMNRTTLSYRIRQLGIEI